MKRLTWLALIVGLTMAVGCPGDSDDGDDGSSEDGSAGSGSESAEPGDSSDASSDSSAESGDDADSSDTGAEGSDDATDGSESDGETDTDSTDATDATSEASAEADCDAVPADLTACLGNIAEGCWDPDMSGTCEQSVTREVTWSDGHKTVNLGGTPGLYAPGDPDGSPCITSEVDSRTFAVTNTNTMNGAVVVNADNGDGTITFTCTDGSMKTFTVAEAELSNVCRGVQCELSSSDPGASSGDPGSAGETGCASAADCGEGSLCCDLGAVTTCIPDNPLGCVQGTELP